MNLLLLSWDVTSALESTDEGDLSSTSQGYFSSRVKIRARKALERIYKAAPNDVVESVVWFWDRTRFSAVSFAPFSVILGSQKLLQGPESEARVFSMLDILAPSAQTIVSMVCEKLAPKSSGSSDKGKNQAVSCVLSSPFLDVSICLTSAFRADDVFFAFLEAYLDRMEGAIAVQVWSVCLSFVRDFLSNISSGRPYIFSCLRLVSSSLAEINADKVARRCFTTLSERVSQTSALEDRRMRRDLQETFIRLVDASIQIAGRAVEQGGWVRRAVMDGTPTGASSLRCSLCDDADSSPGDTDSLFGKAEPDEIEDEKKTIPAGNQAHEAGPASFSWLTSLTSPSPDHRVPGTPHPWRLPPLPHRHGQDCRRVLEHDLLHRRSCVQDSFQVSCRLVSCMHQ